MTDNEKHLSDTLRARLAVDIPDETAPYVVSLRFPIARVVDVRGPMEAQEDYAAGWLREWMASR